MEDIYQNHPKWRELERLVAKAKMYGEKARKLREQINKDLFGSQKSNGGTE